LKCFKNKVTICDLREIQFDPLKITTKWNCKLFKIKSTKSEDVLNQGVKRNSTRFPEDFMFQLSDNEMQNLRSQFVTLENNNFSHFRYNPFVFTEQGVAMLSSVLRSEKAVQINIAIMRTFVAIRQYAFGYKDLKDKLDELEARYDNKFDDVYEVLDQLLSSKNERKEIGFKKD
jgi:ORF6N domain